MLSLVLSVFGYGYVLFAILALFVYFFAFQKRGPCCVDISVIMFNIYAILNLMWTELDCSLATYFIAYIVVTYLLFWMGGKMDRFWKRDKYRLLSDCSPRAERVFRFVLIYMPWFISIAFDRFMELEARRTQSAVNSD